MFILVFLFSILPLGLDRNASIFLPFICNDVWYLSPFFSAIALFVKLFDINTLVFHFFLRRLAANYAILKTGLTQASCSLLLVRSSALICCPPSLSVTIVITLCSKNESLCLTAALPTGTCTAQSTLDIRSLVQ